MQLISTARRGWLWAVALALVAAAGGLWHRELAPAAVRMLPPGETLAYLNLGPLRAAGWTGGEPLGPERAAAYAAFVRDSGFDFERDLDAVAVSLAGAPTAPAATTAVIEGWFSPRFIAYLETHAQRRMNVAGVAAFEFPGWARPEQPLLVVPLDARRVLVTNAAAPAAVVERARRWWLPAPPLWQAGFWTPPPLGYLALDALRLEAARDLDGGAPPWRGARQLSARLAATADGGLALAATMHMLGPDDAQAAAEWAEGEINALRPRLAEDPGEGPTLRALLDRLAVRQQGSQVRFDLQVDGTTLRRWRSGATATGAGSGKG